MSSINPISQRAHMTRSDHLTRYIPRPPEATVPVDLRPREQERNSRMEIATNNQPDRFELFILGDGEKKVEEKTDTRTPNTSMFYFKKEDHTLGNLLACHLLKDPKVMFSGYKVPHPNTPDFELRVQTDGSITPKEAVVNCCKALVADLGQLDREFTKEYELRKMVTGDAGVGASRDNGA